jgi:hypothetical protein
VRYAIVAPEVAKEMTKGLGRKNYFKLPHHDGEHVLVVLNGNESDLGEPLNKEIIDGLDWVGFADCPNGKRSSGSLGAMPQLVKKENEEAEMVTVIAPMIYTSNIEPKEEQAALIESYQETIDLDPHTKDELQDACNKRSKAFIAALEARGAKVITIPRKLTGDLTCIDWQGTIQVILARAREHNPFLRAYLHKKRDISSLE